MSASVPWSPPRHGSGRGDARPLATMTVLSGGSCLTTVAGGTRIRAGQVVMSSWPCLIQLVPHDGYCLPT